VFTGTETVDWLLSRKLVHSRGDGVNYESVLLLGQVIEHVSKSSVEKIINAFSATGTICKQPYPTENAFRIITEPVLSCLFST